MKLYTKIFVIALGTALLEFAVVFFLAFTSIQNSLERAVGEKQQQIAVETMTRVDRALYKYFREIQSIGEENIFENFLTSKRDLHQDAQQRLNELLLLSGPWEKLSIVDADAYVHISSEPRESGTTLNAANLLNAFSSAMNGTTYYSQAILDETTAKPTIIFAAPIHRDNGIQRQIAGVIIGNLPWPIITEILSDFPPPTEFNLYTKNGMLIATNQNTPIFVQPPTTDTMPLIAQTGERRKPTTSIIDDAQKNASILVSTAPSRGYLSYKENGWVLAITDPISEALAPTRAAAFKNTLSFLPIIAATLFLLSLLFFYFRFRFVIQPIETLTRATKEIIAGNLDKQVVINAKDEMGQLAQNFNAMTVQLKNSLGALQEEHARLIASLHSLSLGFVIADRNGAILLANDGATALLETGARLTFQDITQSLGKGFSVAYYAVLKNGESVDVKEVRLRTKILRVLLSPITLPEKKYEVIGVAILLEDVTQQKLVEYSKNSFIAIASHELRTPLSIIRGNAELLLKKLSRETARETEQKMLTSIYNSVLRLLHIVDDFLSLTALEERRMQFKKEFFNVEELIHETILDFGKKLADKNLSLSFAQNPSSRSIVYADRERVKEILINLIGNAVQYTDRGSIAITVAPGSNDKIKISVADTGIGIAQDLQQLIFQKFQTISERFLKSKEYGSGMGLYIAKLMTDAMGGTIWLEHSEPSKGSTFSFELPAG